MEKLPPEMDTSYSGTVWEVPTRTPALYHKYLPSTTQFGVKQNVKWGKLKGQTDEGEDSDGENNDALITNKTPASPEIVYDDAIFPYDIDKVSHAIPHAILRVDTRAEPWARKANPSTHFQILSISYSTSLSF